MNAQEDKVKAYFDYVEKNPNSEEAKKLKKEIYENFKDSSLKLNDTMRSGLSEEEVNYLDSKIKEDTQNNLLVWKMKQEISNINNDVLPKNTMVKSGTKYSYCCYLEKLVNFTNRTDLKEFVQDLKRSFKNA